MDHDSSSTSPLLGMVAEIVSAYVANNPVQAGDLPKLIENVHGVLLELDHQGASPSGGVGLKPAVPIKKSVTDDHIVCLEDGKKLKMLKRHLKTRFDMTPEEYRQRWGLKDDYPMVAPAYAETRSALAKKIGLGRKPEPEKPAKAPRKRAAKKPAAKTR